MKFNLWNIILILTLLFGCQNNRSINGNYSYCIKGEYMEVYFKQDSMRMASENDWVKLSAWKKIEIKNDTLYFESFGEWRDDWKAEIKHVGSNKTELHNLVTNVKIVMNPINDKLNFENSKEFWKEFNYRQISRNCE